MGYTPLEGLVMATRSGTVDPGLLLWLEEHAGIPPAELASALEHHSGLLALAGTADFEAILAAEADGDPGAALAAEVYLHRLRAAIAAMTAATGGLDILLFTGGVGENSALIRHRTTACLAFLGIQVRPRPQRRGRARLRHQRDQSRRAYARHPGAGRPADRRRSPASPGRLIRRCRYFMHTQNRSCSSSSADKRPSSKASSHNRRRAWRHAGSSRPHARSARSTACSLRSLIILTFAPAPPWAAPAPAQPE
jgi:Acetokinase family